MILETIITITLGIITGIITGITPSLHINLVAIIITTIMNPNTGLLTAIYLTSMSITHNYFDHIPNTIFGAGEETNAIMSKNANNYFKKGEGIKAIKLLALGGLTGTLTITTLTPIILLLTPHIIKPLTKIGWIILIGITTHLTLKNKPIKSLTILLLSGALGLITLNTTNMQQPLLPLFSGLFALSAITQNHNHEPTPQIPIYGTPATKKQIIKQGILGTISGLTLGIVPSIGPAQATILLQEENNDDYLIRSGAVNTADVTISLLTLYTLGKARSGVLVEMSKIINLNTTTLITLLLTTIITTIISYKTLTMIGPKILNKITKHNYKTLTTITTIIIITTNYYYNGITGLITLLTSTIIGTLCIKWNTMRSHLMGVLIIPTIIWGITTTL